MENKLNEFERTIQEYLNLEAFTDPLFAKTIKKENKNIKECCSYIVNQVKSSGRNGFTDSEVFSLAKHYYDEDDINIGEKFTGRVVVNHQPILTAEEKAEAKAKAIEQVINEEKSKLRIKKKPTKKVVTETTKAPTDGVIDLFA